MGNAAANETQRCKKIYARKNDVNSFYAFLNSAFCSEEVWALDSLKNAATQSLDVTTNAV